MIKTNLVQYLSVLFATFFLYIPAQAQIGSSDGQAHQIQFEEIHRVTDPIFGQVWNYLSLVSVDSTGAVYVADDSDKTITKLKADGTFVRRFGGEGQGPGEFQQISSLQVIGQDTLLISDGPHRRFTYWPSDSETPARVERLRHSGSMQAAFRLTPHRIITTDQMAYRGDDAERDNNRQIVAALHAPDGRLKQDSVRTWPVNELLVARDRGVVAVDNNPFGRKNLFAIRPSRLYRTWTGEPGVTIYDANLDIVESFMFPHDAPPVSSEEIDQAVDEITFSGWVGEMMRSTLRDIAPATWPPVIGMFVDSQEHIWFGLRTSAEEKNRWVQYSSDGRLIAEAALPHDVKLAAIRGNRAYGIAQESKYGGDVVVIYRINR